MTIETCGTQISPEARQKQNEILRRPLSLEVDFSDVHDMQTEAELVIDTVKKADIYKEKLLFCGFNGNREFDKLIVI